MITYYRDLGLYFIPKTSSSPVYKCHWFYHSRLAGSIKKILHAGRVLRCSCFSWISRTLKPSSFIFIPKHPSPPDHNVSLILLFHYLRVQFLLRFLFSRLPSPSFRELHRAQWRRMVCSKLFQKCLHEDLLGCTVKRNGCTEAAPLHVSVQQNQERVKASSTKMT